MILPITLWICDAEIAPGRRRTGVFFVKSITVDSRPCLVLPPSMINGIDPSKSDRTCFAEVGLGLPDKLADGAAIGTPAF